MKLLVCGAAGFIGSTFVELRVREHGDEVTVLDALTYAGRQENLQAVESEIRFVHGAIEDPSSGRRAPSATPRRSSTSPPRPTSTVRSPTRSRSASPTARARTCCWRPRASGACATSRSPPTRSTARSRPARSPRPRRCSRPARTAPPRPAPICSSLSYFHTYGLPTLVSRGSNNYGPRQYPEKLIPLMILNALAGDHLPVYGDGRNVRNWLYVEDFGRGIGHVLEHGRPGEVYNCGGPDECENLEVVRRILALTGADESLIEYVTDRPGHDRRYSLSSDKLAGARLAGADRVRGGPGAAPSTGTGRTPGGGSRSAPAPTASTTSATTAARSRHRSGGDGTRAARSPAGGAAAPAARAAAAGRRAGIRRRGLRRRQLGIDQPPGRRCRRRPSTSTSPTRRSACWRCSTWAPGSSRTRWRRRPATPPPATPGSG